MHPTSVQSAHGLPQGPYDYRRDRRILALLVALACLAGLLAIAELQSSPSGPMTTIPQVASPAGSVTLHAGAAAARRERLAVMQPPGQRARTVMARHHLPPVSPAAAPGGLRFLPIWTMISALRPPLNSRGCCTPG